MISWNQRDDRVDRIVGQGFLQGLSVTGYRVLKFLGRVDLQGYVTANSGLITSGT